MELKPIGPYDPRRPQYCRMEQPRCENLAAFHVLFPPDDEQPDETCTNLCRRHCADALRDGARAAHPLTGDCVDSMYFWQIVTWIHRENRCGILVTPRDPFEGWRLQDA